MKTIKFFFPLMLAILMATFCTTALQAQAKYKQAINKVKTASSLQAEQPVLKVAIKVYLCPGAVTATMRAINPDAHSFAYYDEDIFSVSWSRNGLPFAGGTQIDCAGTGTYTAIVTNEITGRQGAASFSFLPQFDYFETKTPGPDDY